MLFQSFTFFFFFIAFFGFYWFLRKRLLGQNLLILCGSYIFYGAWDERFLVLIGLSTFVDHIAALGASGQKIERSQKLKALIYLWSLSFIAFAFHLKDSWQYLISVLLLSCLILIGFSFFDQFKRNREKAYLFLSIIFNLGLLGVFKYFNFFADNFSLLFQSLGIQLSYSTLNIVLPVGISFYTFQTMSYTIDVYRKQMEPCKNLLQVASFISFFPQLVAGPIERGKTFLPQFQSLRRITWIGIKTGGMLFLWGLFKKVVIADNLSIIADPIFSDPGSFSSGELLVALLAFTFQIYCDFSGYSDMARGIARSMGFNLMLNFNLPYIARTPSEFWQRWHISLSSWLRDYLYIPLGGNRISELITYRNLALTMLLGGLWHGASWTFVIWGAFHGLILIVYRLLNVDYFLENRQFKPLNQILLNLAMTTIMFILIVISWLFFRVSNLTEALLFFAGIFQFSSIITGLWSDLFFYITPLFIYQLLQLNYKKLEFIFDLNYFVRFNIILFILCGIVFLSYDGNAAFIYFDF
jgi:D-alanyl-lipoteichoic acid acyltransferase DltB (MBOAT superfamily)